MTDQGWQSYHARYMLKGWVAMVKEGSYGQGR